MSVLYNAKRAVKELLACAANINSKNNFGMKAVHFSSGRIMVWLYHMFSAEIINLYYNYE